MLRAVEQNAADPLRSHRDDVVLGVVFAVLALLALTSYGYHQWRSTLEQRQAAIALTGGDPDRGAEVIVRHGCGGCHVIPGITRADGRVGPALGDVARRVYIAGVLTNTPQSLIAFIVNPKAADPKTAMPITGITEAEARDVAAYLYAIRD